MPSLARREKTDRWELAGRKSASRIDEPTRMTVTRVCDDAAVFGLAKKLGRGVKAGGAEGHMPRLRLRGRDRLGENWNSMP